VFPPSIAIARALLQPQQRAQPMKQLDPNYLDLKHLDPE
jgi:hypothetical protein